MRYKQLAEVLSQVSEDLGMNAVSHVVVMFQMVDKSISLSILPETRLPEEDFGDFMEKVTHILLNPDEVQPLMRTLSVKK